VYESMKKASQIAAATMASAAVPQVAPTGNRAGRAFSRGSEYVHTGPTSNPIEILAARRDAALARVREGQGLFDRAYELFKLANRAPYYKSFAARPTPEELKEVAHADKAMQEYGTALAEANRVLEAATTRLNLKLMGMSANTGVESE
jgi:hypothetical protein